MKELNRDSFTFYASYFEGVELLPEGEQLIMLKAIINFALKGIDPPVFEGYSKLMWTNVAPFLKANIQRYVNGCKGGEYGKLGGAPKGNQNARKQPRNNPETRAKTTPKQGQNNPETTPNIKELSINPTNVVLTSNSENGGGGGSAREEFFRPPENFAQIAANDPEAVKAIFADQLWVEQACMRHAESTFSLAEKYKAFVANCITRGELYHIDIKRIKQHFDNWLNTKKYYDERAKRATASSNGQPATREEREQQIIDYHRAKWGSQSII